VLVCGIDIGSTTIEVVLFDGSTILDMARAPSGAFPSDQAQATFGRIIAGRGIGRSEIAQIVTTGFGRNYFDGRSRSVSEISCHAAGVYWSMPRTRTIIEIGGQDSKMMRLDDNGKVRDFVMNDRCAAGTGKFIETVARTLSLPVEETGPIGMASDQACEISSMCAVFAETEIVGLLHQGIAPGCVLRGMFNAVSRRVIGMSGRLGLEDEIVFTGGVAHNIGVQRALEEITGRAIRVPHEPQFTGALGAAIIAAQDIAVRNEVSASPLHETS
jgi:(R)-2-hydroxyacyl-CoA dehydratese activating ATPase